MTRALAAIASARLTGQPFAVDSLIRTRRSVPPEVTALARQIASGLPDSDKWAFAADFMTRTHRHGNLAMVWPKWALWLLTEEMRPRAGPREDVTKAIDGVVALYNDWRETGTRPASAAAYAAADAANAAARAAASAAANAAYAASAAAHAAASAARAAANARMAERLIAIIAADKTAQHPSS